MHSNKHKRKHKKWSRIKNHKNYEISRKGHVRNRKTKRRIQPTNVGGTEHVNLDHIMHLVSRLVATYFVKNRNPKKYIIVVHINGDRSNNHANNLKWCTLSYASLLYGRFRDKSPIEQYSLSDKLIATYKTVSYAAKSTDYTTSPLSENEILDACRSKRKTAGKWKWKLMNSQSSIKTDVRGPSIEDLLENPKYAAFIPDASNYIATADGRIYGLRNKKFLRQHLNKNGYYCVGVRFDNENKMKTKLVHRLIVMTFLSNPKVRPVVNHINHNKTDNNLNNLEWVTYSENTLAYYKFHGPISSKKQSRKSNNSIFIETEPLH